MNFFKYFLVLMLCCPVILFGQKEQTVNSTIKEVVVYQQGAQVSRTAEIKLESGKTTLVFDSLSPEIFEETIQFESSGQVLIEAVYHQMDYLMELPLKADVEALQVRMKTLKDSVKLLMQFGSVFEQEKEMILANRSIGGDQGVSVSELAAASEFYRSRLIDIENKLFANRNQVLGIKENMVAISKQLLEQNVQRQTPSGKILVNVSTKNKEEVEVKLSYVVGNAGWSPIYDVRVAEIDQPLSLSYKANVFQSSGRDWDNVDLTLSTGDPFISNSKPDLPTYNLYFNNYYRKETKPGVALRDRTVRGRLTDENGEPLIGASVLVQGASVGTVTDIDGYYEIKLPEGTNELTFSYTGYETVQQQVSGNTMDVSLARGMLLDEVVVTGYGRKKSLGGLLRGKVAGVQIRGQESDAMPAKPTIPVAIEKQQTTTAFQIDIPYDIPSDGDNYAVTITTYKINPTFQFEAVPKKSNEAFLIAKLKDWTSYRLLDGKMNIFFKGVYQGQSDLDLSTVEDELELSIGKDEDITIERILGKDYSNSVFLGKDRKVTKSWEISIKNNKKIPIALIVYDQVPISNTNDINVQVEEISNAMLNEQTGELKWNLNIQSEGLIQLINRYAVKYPKGRNLIIE